MSKRTYQSRFDLFDPERYFEDSIVVVPNSCDLVLTFAPSGSGFGFGFGLGIRYNLTRKKIQRTDSSDIRLVNQKRSDHGPGGDFPHGFQAGFFPFPEISETQPSLGLGGMGWIAVREKGRVRVGG